MMTYTVMRQKTYTVEECVKIASDLKMDGIDWVTTYNRDPKELKKLSDDAGLPVVAHTFFLRDKAEPTFIGTAERSLDAACVLGAPVVMIPPAPFPEITDPAENRKRWCEVLAQVAPLAEARGLILTVENFPGAASAFVTAADFYEAKKQIPYLKLTYDDGNAATGEDPVESLKKCFKDVAHVHFKDWDFCDDSGAIKMRNGKFGTAALIGEGDVPSAAVFKTLKELDYKGYINIEYESMKYKADEAIRRALEFLRNI